MSSASPPNLELIDGIPAYELLEGLSDLHHSVVVTHLDGRVLWISRAFEELPGGSIESIDKPLAILCERYLNQIRADLEQATSVAGVDAEHLAGQLHGVFERVEATGRACHQRIGNRAASAAGPALEINAFVVESRVRDAIEGTPSPRSERLCVAILRPATHPSPAAAPAANQRFFEVVLDRHPEATLTIDPSGFITYANERAVRLLGKARGELVDAPISLYFPSSAILPVHASLDAAESDAAAHDPASARTVVELAPGGASAIFVEVTSRKLVNAEGGMVGRVLHLRDATQQQRMTERFKKKIASLESYVHTVSHDLRSPLVSLLGFTRLMQQDYGKRLDETGQRFLDRIEQAGANMNRMTQDLLELSTREQTATREREAVDPRSVLLQLQAELKPRLEERSIDLVLPSAPPMIQCDRTQLYQIFSNLVGNALQHMGPCDEPRIEIEIEESNNRRVIVVRDNGRGIASEAHDQIFDAFHSLCRDDGSRSTGVGLAIVKKIALAHGGKVEVESEPGHGATFRVSLEHR